MQMKDLIPVLAGRKGNSTRVHRAGTLGLVSQCINETIELMSRQLLCFASEDGFFLSQYVTVQRTHLRSSLIKDGRETVTQQFGKHTNDLSVSSTAAAYSYFRNIGNII